MPQNELDRGGGGGRGGEYYHLLYFCGGLGYGFGDGGSVDDNVVMVIVWRG